MPSPIGHALAGIAVAWSAESKLGLRVRAELQLKPEPTSGRKLASASGRTLEPKLLGLTMVQLTVLCAVLAAIPDIDLVYLPFHRTATHSVIAAIFITIIAAAVTGWVTGRASWRIAFVFGAAYGSHLVLDWIGADASLPHGIQALWPFSHRWFIAPCVLFPGTERRAVFSLRTILINVRALVAELVIMGPVVGALWFRRRRRSRARISDRDGRPQPSA